MVKYSIKRLLLIGVIILTATTFNPMYNAYSRSTAGQLLDFSRFAFGTSDETSRNNVARNAIQMERHRQVENIKSGRAVIAGTQSHDTVDNIELMQNTTQSFTEGKKIGVEAFTADVARAVNSSMASTDQKNMMKAFYSEYPVAKLQSRRLTPEGRYQHHFEMHVEYENVIYNVTLRDQLPPDLKFLQNNETLCQQRNVDVLFYIISAPHHLKERQLARETWAKTQTLNNYVYSAVYFIGRTESSSINQRLAEEFQMYGDVIQLDMVDSYENLTLKGVGALKWMNTYCSDVQYVIKTDDDLLLDIRHFADVIRMQMLPEDHLHPKMFCLYGKNETVHRQKSSKWYVSPHQLPGLVKYPPFCFGGFYGYPGFLLPKMHQASMLTPVFWLEDVYFNGFVVPQLHTNQLSLVNIKEVWYPEGGTYSSTANRYKIYYDVNPRTAPLYWRDIKRRYNEDPLL